MRSCVLCWGVWVGCGSVLFYLWSVGVGWCYCFGLVLVLLWVGWVVWVWLPGAGDVVGFLVEESRLRRLPRGGLDRLLGLARAAGEFEGLFFGGGGGDAVCLGYYVLRWGGSYRVYVVVAYYSSSGPFIEVIDVEEWVSVARARGLAARG